MLALKQQLAGRTLVVDPKRAKAAYPELGAVQLKALANVFQVSDVCDV